jgi:uncharacterized protein (TIGR03790 family)
LVIGLGWLAAAGPVGALGPRDVFILVNKNMAGSREVADHYCKQRGVPRAHVIELDLPKGEDISRQDYQAKLVAPLRAALKGKRKQVKVLLSVYGVPLRVGGQQPGKEDQAELTRLRSRLDKVKTEEKTLQAKIAALEADNKKAPSKELAAKIKEARDQDRALLARQQKLEGRIRWHQYDESHAAVDSELMLLWWDDYELRRWQLNLLNFQVPDSVRKGKPPTLMVSRLDGPTAALCKKLVDQAVAVEKKGLRGKVYVDARGIKYNPAADSGYGYGGYDESLREMARLLKGEAKLSVTLDDKPELFKPGSCPECALYCGWYSLANYVDCCKFVPGAVAYHIASSEAVSLRDARSKYWCKCLLENGVAATLGPVAEPYTIGFPKPAEFFGLLVTGKYTLVECYARTLIFNSWMTVLVGDPLYNPYGKTPKLAVEKVKPSPAKGKFILQMQKKGPKE